MAKHLDEQVAAFRNRPLDAGPYPFVWVDALTQKVRKGGRIISVHALIAVGVNADGHREIIGIDVATCEDGADWLAFLRSLTARGLSGVQLVISDAHTGLVAVPPAPSWSGPSPSPPATADPSRETRGRPGPFGPSGGSTRQGTLDTRRARGPHRFPRPAHVTVRGSHDGPSTRTACRRPRGSHATAPSPVPGTSRDNDVVLILRSSTWEP
jgi:hypothetical protein